MRPQQGHTASICCVVVLMDSRRVISSDHDSMTYVWLAEGGNLLQTIQGPYKYLAATNNMKFAVSINVCGRCLSQMDKKESRINRK